MAGSGRSSSIRSFHDPSIAKGQFLADLLAAVQPGIVNFALIRPGDTEEEREMNAKYCVSIARKLGCFLFLVRSAMTRDGPGWMLHCFVYIVLMHYCGLAHPLHRAEPGA